MRLGGLNFGGPIMWFLLFLFVLAFAGAVFQAIDLARRKDEAYDKLGRVVWMPIPLLFVFAVLAAFIGYFMHFKPVLTAAYGLVLFALMLANLIQLPAYLLRVVYPTPQRALKLAEMHDAEAPEWAYDALEEEAARKGLAPVVRPGTQDGEAASAAPTPNAVEDPGSAASPAPGPADEQPLN